MLVLGVLIIIGGVMFMVSVGSGSLCAGPMGACQANYDYTLLVVPLAVAGAFLVAGIGMRILHPSISE